MSALGCTFKNMTEPDIDLPLREHYPSSWPQGGPLLPGLAIVAQAKPNDWHWDAEFLQQSPDGAIRQPTTSANFQHSPKALVQQQTHTSFLSSLKFLINSCLGQKVSLFSWRISVKWMFSDFKLLPPRQPSLGLQMRWGQPDPPTGV